MGVQVPPFAPFPRRHFLEAAAALLLPSANAESKPVPPPIPEPHFPSRLYQFVWRNWELANVDRMAQVLGTAGKNVLDLGYAMGLPVKRTLRPDQLRRLYITVIRQNWHLLPEHQIIQLLGWDRPRFAFVLKEDDFLDVKLSHKPDCAELLYHAPSPQEVATASHVRALVRQVFGASFDERGEELFDFIGQLSRRTGPPPEPGRSTLRTVWQPRFLYSFFALYGDPLLETDLDPFPDGYLEKLARVGIDGVWMQAVLSTLAPSPHFPEFGAGSETRLSNLDALVQRARRFGIKIYLYLNEPRSMPPEFFTRHPDMRGTTSMGRFAMCTSNPQVRAWIAASIDHVVRRVPGLGGFFTITMSENHTNCFSHGGGWSGPAPQAKGCPRCSQRNSWDVIAELIHTYREGIGTSGAQLIAWDWGWSEALARHLIPLLPRDVRFQSISEWDQPIHRGGIDTKVAEYSISVVGPGPRARHNWALARACGLETMAKVQFNNTWEISAVPYIPVPHLVLEHCRGLMESGIAGVMASWTCGGYPSPNLDAAQAYYTEPRPSHDQILLQVASRCYGRDRAPHAVEAWRIFSQAFQEFPFGVHPYLIPTQHGPANLLRLHPTGHRPGMILFPHDNLPDWCGAYPPAAVHQQFSRLAARWEKGLSTLRRATAGEDLAIAETCWRHFRSVANQVRFYMLRENSDSAAVAEMRTILRDEIELARRQFLTARRHSVIAYEASNHYYYTPLDLAEKILNCHQILEELSRRG